ncbi:MAG: gamma-glutamylcyclotransferase [Candidatus Heimdallarchaeota archaeon]|nr:gamma-glutamylcyclotransferase [Candidatus Heimdallarchaeota archaeon]
MSPTILMHRIGEVREIGIGILLDHELHFPRYSRKRRNEQEATYEGRIAEPGLASSVRYKIGSQVYGVVFEVSESQLDELDIYENISSGYYNRRKMDVQAEDKQLPVVVYVHTGKSEVGALSSEYLDNIIIQGDRLGFPDSYLDLIKKLKSCVLTVSAADIDPGFIFLPESFMKERGILEMDIICVLYKQKYLLLRAKEGPKCLLSIVDWKFLEIDHYMKITVFTLH